VNWRIRLFYGGYSMKPGITSWAQVNGLRGLVAEPHIMQRRIGLDLFYIETGRLSWISESWG
jgi:lipopolysaccharide/colanic/teichoic acid biosynthesis glycosyltransferase